MFTRSSSVKTPSGRVFRPGILTLLAAFGSLCAFVPNISSAEKNVEQAASKTTPTRIFGGKVQLALPKTANKPKKVSSSLYSIQPQSKSQKFVIFVTKEPVRKDELKKGNKELGSSIKQLLEAQGYEVTSLTNRGTTYTANFRAYAHVPWQLVGTTATRGTAKFVRTKDNEIIGSMLLCDPSQWTDPGIGLFKKAVSGAKVSSK